MRYVKALVAFLTTSLAVVVAAAVLQADPVVTPSSALWLAGVYAFWASSVVAVVSAPVDWIDQLLRSEGAAVTDIAKDREFTLIERMAAPVAIFVWSMSALEIVIVLVTEVNGARRIGFAIGTMIVSGIALGVALHKSLASTGPFKRTMPTLA